VYPEIIYPHPINSRYDWRIKEVMLMKRIEGRIVLGATE
jgi:hypothetical protein